MLLIKKNFFLEKRALELQRENYVLAFVLESDREQRNPGQEQ